jgi:hypothetical protein
MEESIVDPMKVEDTKQDHQNRREKNAWPEVCFLLLL